MKLSERISKLYDEFTDCGCVDSGQYAELNDLIIMSLELEKRIEELEVGSALLPKVYELKTLPSGQGLIEVHKFCRGNVIEDK